MMNNGGIGMPLGFPLGPTSVIQVTNLSSAVTSAQMRTLFCFLGDIEELRLYPPDFLAFIKKLDYNNLKIGDAGLAFFAFVHCNPRKKTITASIHPQKRLVEKNM
uniref:RRM domain-containing protein n=1 Tax=Amazona collaria TaxID=241587 RepID=A0A8B9FPD3_9PSIT